MLLNIEIPNLYQRLCRCMGIDRAVRSVLDFLEKNGLSENTIVYTSDQGFYLGEHGWFDKRWMYEESFKMPFLIKSRSIEAGTALDAGYEYCFCPHFWIWLE